MNYTLAISVCLSLEDQERFSEDDVLDAVDTILGMETINAVPKQALLNALRWFWDKCVEEVEPSETEDLSVHSEPYDLLYEEGGANTT